MTFYEKIAVLEMAAIAGGLIGLFIVMFFIRK